MSSTDSSTGIKTQTTEDTAVSVLDEKGNAYFAEHYSDPLIHLAVAVYIGSLLKLKTYPFTPGESEVKISAGNYSPEYTPKNFKPTNEVDLFLFDHPEAFSQKVTFPFVFEMDLFRRAVSVNKFSMIDEFKLEDLHAYKSECNPTSGLLVEFKSKSLNRSLYIDIFSSV